MTRAEIAQLKEELTADYKRKLEALELVEQMLNQQQTNQSPIAASVRRVGRSPRSTNNRGLIPAPEVRSP